MLICDTSGLLSYFDVDEPDHAAARAAVQDDNGPLVVSPLVLAELDYLLASRRGTRDELTVLGELGGGAWEIPPFGAADLRHAAQVVERYADQSIGLTDASLVVLAERYRTNRLLTLDRRHFQVVRTAAGRRFTLLLS